MHSFELDDISPVDLDSVQQLTSDFLAAAAISGTHARAKQELARDLHKVLKPYNAFSSSLLLKVAWSCPAGTDAPSGPHPC